MNITIGNLSYRAVEADLRRLFSAHGPVESVQVTRGSGVVTMRDRDAAKAAIRALQRHRFHGRPIEISEAGLSGTYLMDVQEEYADFVR